MAAQATTECLSVPESLRMVTAPSLQWASDDASPHRDTFAFTVPPSVHMRNTLRHARCSGLLHPEYRCTACPKLCAEAVLLTILAWGLDDLGAKIRTSALQSRVALGQTRLSAVRCGLYSSTDCGSFAPTRRFDWATHAWRTRSNPINPQDFK